MKARPLKRKTNPHWRKGNERWDLVLMGDPDCHAYIIRYWSNVCRDAAWCWCLTMPRGSASRFSGWASSAFAAKLQVESAIRNHWIQDSYVRRGGAA